ncbi:amidohydrolase [Streptococcus parasanguinis]|uniref:amidohydrolase n=1 Tax=Streptococcus parasanguinis TaxID=1318 RepID=UPI00066BF59D|nr:amidohydrolase [Streptococcus parasanguinis]MDK8142971.1 amidohydrolase [Streptococcus parasanguinis]MDU6915862.1 amidohydrolase [Staphylococcus epidermidis]
MSFSYEELAEIRYYIHQHPELSGQEYQTTAFLKERLEELGIRILESGLKTGLIAEIGSGQPVVALRADIDALPILEQTNLPYKSQNPGVMHACGHDFHQTSLLGAAALLKEKEDQLEGTVRLIFQPAEEISEGASDVLATGLLEDVQGIIGFHNIPQLKAGQLALNAGAMMAGVEKFKVTVTGVSSHAARPDLGVDTVTAITTMVQNLQLLISRTVSPFETAVLSITHLDVGSTWNVLPKSGYFEGTIRSFNPSVQRELKEHFVSIVRHIAKSLEVDVAFEWGVTPPVTFNDEELTKVVCEASQDLAEVLPANPSTAGEDFAFYQERIPGVFAFIGSNGEPDAPDLHHDHMTIDDAAFEVSVPYYVENAQALLRYFKAKEV